jgi:hypothetical protein
MVIEELLYYYSVLGFFSILILLFAFVHLVIRNKLLLSLKGRGGKVQQVKQTGRKAKTLKCT